jgi:hypothetical protein
MANDLLNVLHHHADYFFSRIVTEDESWFLCLYSPDDMSSVSREKVIPREKATGGASKVLSAIFFSGVSLITLNTLPSRARSN